MSGSVPGQDLRVRQVDNRMDAAWNKNAVRSEGKKDAMIRMGYLETRAFSSG